MDRREFFGVASGALAGTAFPFVANASGGQSGPFKHPLLVSDPKALRALEAVRAAAFECLEAGEACAQHCQEELLKGNKNDFVDCSLAVRQMLPVCENIGALAAQRAKIIESFLDGCIEACNVCAKACKQHEKHFAHGMHLACKACLEACIACREACEELQKTL